MPWPTDPLNFLELRRRMRENGDLAHIQHMLHSAELIGTAVDGKSKSEVMTEMLLYNGVLFSLQSMGTAAVYVSRFSRQRFPAVPWRRIINIRNKIVRNLLEPDYDEIWKIIQSELPQFKDNLKEVITTLEAQ